MVRSLIRAFKHPKKLIFEEEKQTDTYGEFIAEPFEKGYGVTIGNSLRRVLLSSITGSAISAIKIDGVAHEFDVIKGVKEDIPRLLLNLKRVSLNYSGDDIKVINITKKGPGVLTAGDLEVSSDIFVYNKDLVLATLDDEANINMELQIENGRGYEKAENKKKYQDVIGTITLDTDYSPVERVAFDVESTRVGQRTDYERLIIKIHTNGVVKPIDALASAAKILKDHLTVFINFEEAPSLIEDMTSDIDKEKERLKEILSKSVEELELSVRSANCLKHENIKTIGDLVKRSETEMLKFPNFGKKSLSELREILEGYELRFGMKDLDILD